MLTYIMLYVNLEINKNYQLNNLKKQTRGIIFWVELSILCTALPGFLRLCRRAVRKLAKLTLIPAMTKAFTNNYSFCYT